MQDDTIASQVHSIEQRISADGLLIEQEMRFIDDGYSGSTLVFLNHELGRSPEGDMLLQVQGIVAQYERAQIMERSRRGKLHAARRGCVSVLTQAPYEAALSFLAVGFGICESGLR